MRSTIRKSWYTLAGAADRLFERYRELEATDLLQLAIEGKLSLSVIFAQSVRADLFLAVSPEKIVYEEVPTLDGKDTLRLPVGGAVVYDRDGTPFQKTGKSFELVEGSPFELAMIGGELADVQADFWRRMGRPREETTNLDGTFCKALTPDGPALLRLMAPFGKEREGYYPVGALPSEAMLVVTDAALNALLEPSEADNASSRPQDRPVVQGWPWGAHTTALLAHLDAAARRFWTNFDPSDISTAPTNEQVSGWLHANGVSQRIADVMATILRADGLPTGPRK